MTGHQLLVTCAPGIEDVLEREIRKLGIEPGSRVKGGVLAEGDDEVVWRACLGLRTASRVQRLLHHGAAKSDAHIESALLDMDYSTLLRKGQVVGIELHDSGKPLPKIVALADSIERRLNRKLGNRVEMAKGAKNHVRLVARRRLGELRVSVDVAGKALHKRGWRTTSHEAPLQETLAAALVLLSGYNGTTPFLDPFCGSGSIAIEATYIALGKAPLVHRKKGEFAFERFADFDPRRYRAVLEAVRAQRKETPSAPVLACDLEERRVQDAARCAARARVGHQMGFAVADARSPAHSLTPGVLVSNLPYGVRLNDPTSTARLAKDFAKTLAREYSGWRATLLVPAAGAWSELTRLARSSRPVKNGSIDCLILTI